MRLGLLLQLRLRIDQAKGGGGLADMVFHPLPVFRLRRELIAGDHRPFLPVDAAREQDIRW